MIIRKAKKSNGEFVAAGITRKPVSNHFLS